MNDFDEDIELNRPKTSKISVSGKINVCGEREGKETIQRREGERRERAKSGNPILLERKE